MMIIQKVLLVNILMYLVRMTEICHPLHSGLFWNFTLPSEEQEPALIILISDWIYGILPYCGPGARYDVWTRERIFQDEICRFLNHLGMATLSLSTSRYDDNPPPDSTLVEISSEFEVISSIKQLIKEKKCSFRKTVIFGHGFGTRLLCKLAASGIKPAGYIVAAGLYSDTDSILNQKYLPYKNTDKIITLPQICTLDPDTDLILKNFGKILYSIRKDRGRIRLQEDNLLLDLLIPKELFSFDSSSEFLLSYLNAPTLIIHGSGDLDIPVSNAFFLEQKLKQQFSSVSRIVLLDCDHWFREMPSDVGTRLLERLNGDCIHHKINPRFFKNIRIFIQDVLKISTNRMHSPIEMPEENEMISSV